MVPQRLQHEPDASPQKHDVATANPDAGDPKDIGIQGLNLRLPPPARTAVRGVAKETILNTAPEESPQEDSLMRDSWISFASTARSRDSAAPSIFSVRASTTTASTRYSLRQSSVESPISAISRMHQEHYNGGVPHASRYCCTFCDAAFDSKTEWKLHELEFHDRRERYLCGVCPATFPRAVLLTEHVRGDHGLDPATDTTEPIQCSPIRSAWGCGFCAAFILSRNDYLEHVGRHYDEGKEKSDWQHTRVIEGLLRQPRIEAAWTALVSKEEHARASKLRFLWDPDTTGRVDDATESSLQDMLEFFATGTRQADEVAAAAYSSAHVRLESNLSDLVSRLYLRHPEPRSGTRTLSQPSPELQPASDGVEDDMVSPISPLPAPLRPLTTPPRVSDLSLAAVLSAPPPPVTRAPKLGMPKSGNTTIPAKESPRPTTSSVILSGSGPRQIGHPDPLEPFKHRALRRIGNARNLGLPGQTGTLIKLDQDKDTVPPQVKLLPASRASSQMSLRHTAEPAPPLSAKTSMKKSSGICLWTTEAAAMSSVRPHTSSSTLSTTGEGSQGLDDSTSEITSDDSFSEPDCWPEPSQIPGTTRTWEISFRQTVDRGMGRLWARYNHHMSSLIRQCVGGQSTDSAQLQQFPRRVRKGASSRYALGNGLRPKGFSLGDEDEEDDDEGQGYRPPNSLSKHSSGSTKRFACPFRKHDPHTYNIRDHEVCAIRSWCTISRLKEHLYRRHYIPHCQRCKQTFPDARGLAEHEMSVTGCQVLDIAAPGDITTYQEKQLKSRKHTTRRQTDEEKWRDIYRLLFPDEGIPSPYPEPTDDLAPVSSEPRLSLDFQHFLLSEMPGLVTKTAEEHAGRRLQAHEGLPMEAIPRIIEDALRKAFRAWDATSSHLPTREASVASMSFLSETPPPSLAYSFGQSTAYPSPQPPAAINHNFPNGQFSTTDFTPEIGHAASADDSGFTEDMLFTSGPPVDFNAFASQYGRAPWEGGLGVMDMGSFESQSGVGGQFRGFQDG
ncbi:hypothetical protein C8A03DRAFT_17418 [Achaetomium macrosporum]|uniref:C2H2-type domain-containing protein n=1 Tax=Achaetomium macrosporum TaxID=79813 RepID=A0AAN7HC65_9PEZI|nr:hypothetical protein C8A03DRAFT_17418 [Achaetomium macrosporum]